MPVARAIIVVPGEAAVRAGINAQRNRLFYDLACMLTHRPHGHNSSSPYIERHGFKIHFAREGSISGRARTAPEIPPVARGQIHLARASVLLMNRRNQEALAPQILVVDEHGFRIAGPTQAQRPHQRHAGFMRTHQGRIVVGQKLVAQVEILAADHLNVCPMQVSLTRPRSNPITGHLLRTRVARVPSPRQPQFPGAAVPAEQGAERAPLKPAQEEFRRQFRRGHKAADVGSPVRNARQPRVDAHHDLRAQRGPG